MLIDKEQLFKDLNKPAVSKSDDKIKPVAKGRIEKERISKRFIKSFIGDHNRSIKDYVIDDIVVPMVNDTIIGLVDNFAIAVQMALLGEAYKGSKKKNGTYLYDKQYGSSGREKYKSRHNMGDVTFETSREAKDVLETMLEVLDQYDSITVAEYYKLAGVTSNNRTDRQWGWTNIRGTDVRKEGREFILTLPKPKEL